MEIRYCIHSDGSSHKPYEAIQADGEKLSSIIYCPDCDCQVKAVDRLQAVRMWNGLMRSRQLRAMRKAGRKG